MCALLQPCRECTWFPIVSFFLSLLDLVSKFPWRNVAAVDLTDRLEALGFMCVIATVLSICAVHEDLCVLTSVLTFSPLVGAQSRKVVSSRLKRQISRDGEF